MNPGGPLQSSPGRIALAGSAIVALGLVGFSVQSVIRAWRSSPQAPVASVMPVDREQPAPEPAAPAPALPGADGAQSGSPPRDFFAEEKAARQSEEARREIMQRRAKDEQENPDAGSMTNEQPVL